MKYIPLAGTSANENSHKIFDYIMHLQEVKQNTG